MILLADSSAAESLDLLRIGNITGLGALHGALACAFRADNLSPADMKEVADFKNIVLNYMKMERLLEK